MPIDIKRFARGRGCLQGARGERGMERELARLATAYLSLQRVQRAVPPRTRRGSAELRTFSVQSRRVDLYPRVRACVESGLGEGGAEGRRRACDALRRLEAYELFSTPLPEELGGVKAYQGDGDVVEVHPIKRRVVVDLTGGPDSGNASGRRPSQAREATVEGASEEALGEAAAAPARIANLEPVDTVVAGGRGRSEAAVTEAEPARPPGRKARGRAAPAASKKERAAAAARKREAAARTKADGERKELRRVRMAAMACLKTAESTYRRAKGKGRSTHAAKALQKINKAKREIERVETRRKQIRQDLQAVQSKERQEELRKGRVRDARWRAERAAKMLKAAGCDAAAAEAQTVATHLNTLYSSGLPPLVIGRRSARGQGARESDAATAELEGTIRRARALEVKAGACNGAGARVAVAEAEGDVPRPLWVGPNQPLPESWPKDVPDPRITELSPALRDVTWLLILPEAGAYGTGEIPTTLVATIEHPVGVVVVRGQEHEPALVTFVREPTQQKAGSPPSGESPHWVDPAMPPPPQLWPALLCIINSSSTSGLTRLVEAKHEAQEAAARERAAAEEARNRAALAEARAQTMQSELAALQEQLAQAEGAGSGSPKEAGVRVRVLRNQCLP